ncbi:MAG: bifunctional nuclease family protein [Candidatus Bipolaricaulaceae bacterium]
MAADGEFVLILKDKASSMAVPIWIAEPEFFSALHAWRNWRYPRPLTHDLLRSVLDVGQMRVERVEVTEVKEHIFYAKVVVAGNSGEPKVLDARPSDAVALALRVGAPIFVAEEVFSQAGIEWDLHKILLR